MFIDFYSIWLKELSSYRSESSPKLKQKTTGQVSMQVLSAMLGGKQPTKKTQHSKVFHTSLFSKHRLYLCFVRLIGPLFATSKNQRRYLLIYFITPFDNIHHASKQVYILNDLYSTPKTGLFFYDLQLQQPGLFFYRQ